MDPEMIERIALAAYPGSFANEYAKRYAIRFTIEALAALTVADLRKLLAEREAS